LFAGGEHAKNPRVAARKSLCFAILLGAVVTFVFAEPTDVSERVGAAVLAVGGAVWVLALCGDTALPASRRGGIHAFVRNPASLGGFLIAAGIVLFAASEEPRGRWVARTTAPLGLLYFFVVWLPSADAACREWVRRDAGEGGPASVVRDGSKVTPEPNPYLANVPSFVPRLTPWRSSNDPTPPRRTPTIARVATSLVVPLLAAAFALLCHYWGHNWGRV
jgi:hypothetical protein